MIQPAQVAPAGVCLSITDRAAPLTPGELQSHEVEDVDLLHFHFDRAALRARVVAELESAILVGENIAFDIGVLLREFPDLWEIVFDTYDKDRIYDTATAEKLIHIGTDVSLFWIHSVTVKNNPTNGYSLSAIARRRLGVLLDKDTWRKRYGELYPYPCSEWPAGARSYSKGDSRVAINVCAAQMAEPNAAALLVDLYNQTRAAFWIHLMVANGFRTDPRVVRELKTRIEKEIDEVEYRLRRIGLVRPDGSRNMKAAQARMVEACQARGIAPKLTEKGKIALDEDACTSSGDPWLEKYARYTSLQSIHGSIPKLEKPIIQSRFDLAETGRTTCNEGEQDDETKERPLWGFQLQNPRREPGIRECFVPRPGRVLWSVDYGQMELHTWAQSCIDLVRFSTMAEKLNARMDLHMWFGCQVHGANYDEVLPHKKKEPYKDWRQAAKSALFGYPGGLGPKSFVEYAKANYGVILDFEQAKHLKGVWLASFPEAQAYFNYIHAICGGRNLGTIEHPLSRRLRAGVRFTEAANGFFQGRAADCAKDAGFRIVREMYCASRSSPLYGSRLNSFAHDEFIGESPADRAHDAAMEVVRLMEDAGRKWCPDVPPRAEPCLMLRWRKAAEISRDAAGRLRPWDADPAVRQKLLEDGELFEETI